MCFTYLNLYSNKNAIYYLKYEMYYTLVGFGCYILVGVFLMKAFNLNDAFHLFEPLISGTPLTTWVMAPMYIVGYALVLFCVEILKKNKIIQNDIT